MWGDIFGERDDVLREASFVCPEVPHNVQSEGDGTPEAKKRRTECSDWKAGAIAFKVVRRKADVSWEDQRPRSTTEPWHDGFLLFRGGMIVGLTWR